MRVPVGEYFVGFVDSYGSYRATITLSQVSESNEFLHLIQKLYKVKVSVFGIDLVGLAKDSFISIERIDNLVSFRKAQDGSHIGFVDSYGDLS